MKRIIPPLIIALGIVLSFSAFNLLLKGPTRSSATVYLPTQLAGFSITDLQQGMDAIALITDLHRQEFPVDFGAVGVYGDRDIIVWIAGAASESIAVEMTNAMQLKIAEGNSPFTPIDEIDSRNRNVYALEGMGKDIITSNHKI